MSKRPAMTVDITPGQALRLSGVSLDSGEIVITLEQKSGQRARLRVEAGADVKIKRPSQRGVDPQK